jgi:uncharacterized protein with HEPN domain
MPKERNYKMFIEDIITAMNKIQIYTKDMNYETFVENEIVLDAVIRNLEIIGEASKNIPENIRSKYPEIPWNRMIGLRNIAIHEYFGIDTTIIWKIITENLPATKPLIIKLLKSLK